MIHYEKNDPHIIEFYKFKILWVILIFAVSFLFFSANPVSCDFGTSRPGNSAQMAQSGFVNPKKEQQIIRVEVDPEKWSEWVTVPSGCDWRISRPECWEQCWFLGETQARPRVESWEKVWYGKVPTATFKLRGTKGTVEIIIEPK